MSSSTLRKRVSDLISIVDTAPSYYHDLYSQYASNTFTNDIRYLSTLSDPLVEACLSGSSGAHTQALMPLFSNLTLFRSYLSSLCLSNRIKRLACSGAYDPVFSLHFLKHGYVSIPNFLPPDLFQSLSSSLSSALYHSTDLNSTWHHQIPNVLGLPPIHFGTRFLDYSFSQLDTLSLNVSNLIASVTASIVQPVGGQIAQVIHYTHDPVSLFHYDNDGITSIKWFYFPFEPSSNDSGFLYASGSQRVTDTRSKMLTHMNKSYLDAVPVSNMRPEELDSIYPIHSFNKANSLVIANTAGFHARATVPSGIQRITIQGGTDNTRSFYP